MYLFNYTPVTLEIFADDIPNIFEIFAGIILLTSLP
jgi:hypothetical protein